MPIIARLLNYCDLRNNDLLPSSQSIRSVINTPDWHSPFCSITLSSGSGEVSKERERERAYSSPLQKAITASYRLTADFRHSYSALPVAFIGLDWRLLFTLLSAEWLRGAWLYSTTTAVRQTKRPIKLASAQVVLHCVSTASPRLRFI